MSGWNEKFADDKRRIYDVLLNLDTDSVMRSRPTYFLPKRPSTQYVNVRVGEKTKNKLLMYSVYCS